jgi:hypothetical protein
MTTAISSFVSLSVVFFLGFFTKINGKEKEKDQAQLQAH